MAKRTNLRLTIVALMVVLIGVSSAWVSATELVAYSYDDNCLYRLNTSDMQPSKIGALQISFSTDPWELVRASENSLYVVDRNANILYEISLNDASTISSVPLDQDVFISARGLDISPEGILYGLLPGMQLRTIDPSTGETTFVANVTGATNIEVIAFGLDSTLYAVGNGSNVLYELDINTGSLSWIANLPVTDIDTLTFSTDGHLYGVDAKAGMVAALYKIDPHTGTTVNMGSTGIKELNGLVAQALIHLEIIGPDEVAEDSQTHYQAIASYEGGSSADVTASAIWSVEPNDIADVNAGLLTTEMVDLPMDVTITAEYSEGGIDEVAEKNVSILTICPSGSALEFDGVDDYVGIQPTTDFDFGTGDFTVTAWFKTDSTVIGPQIINFRHNDNNPHIELYVNGFVGLGSLGTHILTDSGAVRMEYAQAGINDSKWHNAAITFKNGESDGYKLYLDGAEVAQDTLSCTLSNWDKITIGARILGVNQFSGTVDDVHIYNQALSAEEIQASMHLRPDTNDPNLVAYWDFDEGEGTVAGDSAGGNDGTLESGYCDPHDPECGGPVWVDSDAPVGICTLDGLVERNLNNIRDRKLGILGKLGIVLGKEYALLDYVDDAFHNGQLDNLNKGDVAKAKGKIHSAIRHEIQAKRNIYQSLDKLEDALIALGGQGWRFADPEELESGFVMRADVNGDGIVDHHDFAILSRYWLRSYEIEK